VADVPTTHDVDEEDCVIAKVTFHVSPGVVKLVGADVPFVQFERTVMSPAVAVVHTVALLSKLLQQNSSTKKNILAENVFNALLIPV
jgi:hypothetical protein